MKPVFRLSRTMARTALASALLTAPVTAQGADAGSDLAQAEKTLRGCLAAGSSTAPRTGLRAAVPYVRAFCGTQINRVEDARLVPYRREDGAVDPDVRKRVRIGLNDEIAHAIATFTGLDHL